MNTEHVLDLTRESIRILFMLSGPILASGLVVGVITNIFQAVTQISENTLAIVPKIVVMLVAFVLLAPWMLDVIIDFTTQLYQNIPQTIR